MKKADDSYDLSGLGKVYRFTLSQTFKNPAYRVSFIAFVLMFTLMGPISSLSRMAGESAAQSSDALYTENEADGMILINHTLLPIDSGRLSDYLKGTAYEDLPLREAEDIEQLTRGELALIFDKQKLEDEDFFVVSGVIADDSVLDAEQIDALCRYLRGMLSDVRREAAQLSDEQLKILQMSLQAGDCIGLSEYRAQDRGEYTDQQVFELNMIYCVMLVIMVALTTSYVMSSVMEEKSSRLVESLLVSVRPLALVGGKILAMMSYVGLMLTAGILGSRISGGIMSMLMDGEASGADTALDFSAIFSGGIGGSLLLLLCMLLSYLLFAILAGVLGSACVKPEDMQSAIGAVTVLNMLGYILGILAPNAGSRALDTALSLIPVVSGYVAPVYFICGRISAFVFIAGLVLECLSVVLLFLLCARTYRRLIVNDAKRLNFIQIVKLSLQGA